MSLSIVQWKDKYRFPGDISLYSTATQNTWRRGLALGNAPDGRILRWRYQHVGIFWRYLTLKFAFSPTPTPDASQWNIGCIWSQRNILALAMYISCFLCRFHLCLVPNAPHFQWNMGYNVLMTQTSYFVVG